MTTDDPSTDAGAGVGGPTTTGIFTREELDAAEPERPPSPRFRWVIGLGLGAFAGLYTGFPLGIVALPFAFTGAGAGALLGSGIVFLASFAFDAFVWLNDELAAVEPWTFVSWTLAGCAALAAGIAGSIVVARRSRRPAVA
jgi:hypothetical protein